MARISLNVQRQLCGECSLALRRFIGGMEGVESISVENTGIAIDFDEKKMPEDDLRQIALDSMEKLGYRVSGE